MSIVIRKGVAKDIPAVLDLIKELAVYEKAPAEVEVTQEEMLYWGFGEHQQFYFFVAVHQEAIVGIALYYFKYSTWKGRCLFLEDLIVTESYRQKGIGTLLFNEIIQVSKMEKVRRMEWQVLHWNAPAIAFYRKYGAILDEEWVNGKLTHYQLKDLP